MIHTDGKPTICHRASEVDNSGEDRVTIVLTRKEAEALLHATGYVKNGRCLHPEYIEYIKEAEEEINLAIISHVLGRVPANEKVRKAVDTTR